MANTNSSNKGFTLVELIAVIVVLAIILAITVPGITGVVRSSTMKAVESNAKLVLDSIRLKKIADDTFDPTNLNKSNIGNLLGLSDENYSDLEVKINEGQTYIKITGEGRWSGLSACGTYFDMQVNEGNCYLDFNPPVITLLGDSFVSINVGQAYTDAGATANDVEDGDITGRIVVTGTVNPNVPGTYNMIYNVSDTAGRDAISVTRTVYVIDVEAPVITILGDNPTNINVGDTYSDAGATASDDADGDVTSRIITTGTVNPSVAGIYTITYTVSDNAGHESTAVRTVNVIDNVLPTLTFSMNGNETWAKTRSTTVTVSDTHTGVDTSSLKYQWTTSTTAPTEASFATAFTNGGTLNSPAGVTGAYYLWILAKDNAGNVTIISTNVFNLDNTVPSVPTVNFNGYTIGSWTSSNITIGFSSTDAGSGIQKYQYTADGSNWFDVTNPYTINTDGDYWRAYRSVDNAGNVSAVTTSYHIGRDATPPSVPTVSLNGYTSNTWTKNDVTQTFSSSDATSGIQKYQYSVDGGASWGDLVGSWTINWDGQWTFYIRAVDNAGNISANSSPYIIKRDTVAPVITVNGSNPIYGFVGYAYSDAGATAAEALSGLASAIQVTSNVNPNAVGTYTVTYNVSDNAGNVATQVTRTVYIVNTIQNFAYTGNVQSFVVPTTGTYSFQVWGAQGYDGNGQPTAAGGRGGYATGRKYLTAGQTINIYIGGAGSGIWGGFNGGGRGLGNCGGGGGGTDIRLDSTSLASRIIVAGGGGGGYAVYYSAYDYILQPGGYGGGATGGNAPYVNGGSTTITGGSQTAGGTYGGTLGQGGKAGDNTGNGLIGAGGGGGYYGGGAGENNVNSSGAGGSSYIGGLASASTIAGNASMTAPGGGTETGHAGNGYARIQYVGP